MTVIYAADSESLALLPELLIAKNIDEGKIPSEGHYKEFTPNIDTAALPSETLTLHVGNAPAQTINLGDYADKNLKAACAEALANEGIETQTPSAPVSPKGDKPKF